MFRSKRNSLVKRLWKYRVHNETKSPPQNDPSPLSQSANTTALSLEELKSVTHSFFKRLKEDQLEILVQAMESKGGEITPCVPVSKTYLRLGRYTVSPYYLCCRVFRWPDLKCDAEMKRLPSCTKLNEEKETVVCCNPYHWSQVVKIDEPPIHLNKCMRSPGVSRTAEGRDRNEDGCPKHVELNVPGLPHYEDEHSENSEQSPGCECLLWCTVAYWELRERVGRLFSVNEPSVHIFQQLPHGNGMCLRLFQKPTNLEVVKRTREKIGFGIILSREAAHKNGFDVLGIQEFGEECPSLMAPCSLTLSPSRFQSSSPGTRESTRNNSCISSTSDSGLLTSRHVVTGTGDSLDLVHGAGGGLADGINGAGFGAYHGDTGCGTSEPINLGHGVRPRCECEPAHVGRFDESMECAPAVVTPDSCAHSPLHLSKQPQSCSPSHPSSSSLSSSVSPPSYSHYDTSCSNLHYSDSLLDCGASFSTGVTKHATNNGRINNQCNCHHETPTPSSADINIISRKTTTAATSSHLPCKQGEVWAYNASDFPIFVNSPTLDDPESPRSVVVKKVPPGYSIKIFDYARAELLERTEARNLLLNDGPFDPCSVRISLAKGWGPNYSRQFITSCPCWLEILLGVRRQGPTS